MLTVGSMLGGGMIAFGLLFMPESAPALPNATAITEGMARLIVLTDIGNEPDDPQSMVRLLVNANDIDIEGLVATTSRTTPASN